MGSFCSRNRKHPERPEERRSDDLTQEVMHILSPLSTSKSIGGLVGDNEQGTEARTERRESVATDFGFWLEGWRNLLLCQLPRIHILTKNSPMKISFLKFSLTLRVLKICFHYIIISAFWCSVQRIIVSFSRSANYH